MLVRRTKIEGLEQALHTLELGLVVKQQGKLRVYNRIYASVCNPSWVDETLAEAESSAQSQKLTAIKI